MPCPYVLVPHNSPLYYSRFTIHYSPSGCSLFTVYCLLFMDTSWPELKFSEWQDTLATLHMWTQVVGKIRLKQTPLVNHWWNVPLYVSARGLTTSAMPYKDRIFEIEFDFIDHQLLIECSDGSTTRLALRPQSVADFYAEVMSALHGLGMDIKIWTMPVEIPNPIRFEEDHVSTLPTIRNTRTASGARW